MAASNDQTDRECPLCMEQLELDDLNFYPCTCEYQICRFCWHRIRTDGNCLCPACRKHYPEDPVNFKPLSAEDVVQKNLVFVVGLPSRLADADLLKRSEYFGKFGRIQKIMVNSQSTYVGAGGGPSASAYVTFFKPEDALRAIQGVNAMNSGDGKSLKASLGTTKYCSNFLKNLPCSKPDCMYLHEVGDMEASFTKDEMQQGKHTDYERRLIDHIKTSLDIQNGQMGTAAPNGPSSEQNNESQSPTTTNNIPPRYIRQQQQLGNANGGRNRNRSRPQNKHNKSRSPPSANGHAEDSGSGRGGGRQGSGGSSRGSSGGPSPTGHHNGCHAPPAQGKNLVHPLMSCKPKPTPLLNLTVHHPFAQHNHARQHNQPNHPPEVSPKRAAGNPPSAGDRGVSNPTTNAQSASASSSGGSTANGKVKVSSPHLDGEAGPPRTNGLILPGLQPSSHRQSVIISPVGSGASAQPPGTSAESGGQTVSEAAPSMTATHGGPMLTPSSVLTAVSGNQPNHQPPLVLSPDELRVDTAGLDWQAAFGFKAAAPPPPPGLAAPPPPFLHPQPPSTMRPLQQDDDLGFDPFAESCKGLALLLDEEKRVAGEACAPAPPPPGSHAMPDSVLRLFRPHFYENKLVMDGRQMMGVPPPPANYQLPPPYRPFFHPQRMGPSQMPGPPSPMPPPSHPALLRHRLHCDNSAPLPPHALQHNLPAPTAVSPFWLNDNASYAPRPSVFSETVPAGWSVNGTHATANGPSIS